MIKVSSLIFDMDGTLVDTASDITNSVNYTLNALSVPERSKEEVQRWIGDGMKTLLVRTTGRREESFIQKAVSIFRPHYFEHCTEQTELYPGVLGTLDFFKHKKMAITSNKPYSMVIKILDHFKIRDRFRVVLGAESTKEKKPHPEPLLKSMEILGETAQSCIMIGDGTADIQAGKSASCLTCAVTYGYKERRELEPLKPSFFIDRIEDLKNILC